VDNDNLTKNQKIYEGLSGLSLGISMVVAVVLGIGIGIWLSDIFESKIFLWIGVFWGVGGAVLNVYKAYKKEKKAYDKIAQDIKYQDHFNENN
jgi:F0F1-type ATP synthase assembly protein I